jgi:glycosyltransferase involved in cell wall biosynthesis
VGGDFSSLDPARVVVLIPARNEENAIGVIVAGCRSEGCAVWVMDDGSRDATAGRAESAGARVLKFSAGRGKGAVLREALQQLPPETEWVFFMDGDGQHSPADLPRFWQLRGEADLVMGNRWPDAGAMPLLRRWTNRVMTASLNRIGAGRAQDTQCGFRLVRRAWLGNWKPRGSRFEFESELYLHALARGARIREVPLTAVYAEEKSKIFWPRDTWNFARCLWRAALSARRDAQA